MRKYTTVASAAAFMVASFAGAHEEVVASVPEVGDGSVAVDTRPACCLHGAYAGFGAGFTQAKWEMKPEVIKKNDSKKGGADVSLLFGYAHRLDNGFTAGAEVLLTLNPSTKVKKEGNVSVGSTSVGAKTELKLDTFSPGVFAWVGYGCPQIKGTVGVLVGGSYAKTKVNVAPAEVAGAFNEVKKDFASFSPEFGAFYVCKFWKDLGVRVDFRYAIGAKKKEKITFANSRGSSENIDTELKTNRMHFGVTGIWNVRLFN
jgi:hypothetical protein